MNETKTIGFIILRHVKCKKTNQYWIHCYDCIRNYYPENTILIIDDNSNYEFITEKELYNTSVINSEYPCRGELLPYFYYLHYPFFDIAMILHDSVFMNCYINFSLIDFSIEKYKILWNFDHYWDQIDDEIRMLSLFKDEELLHFHRKKQLWQGCFGGMSIIAYDFLNELNMQYDFRKLLDCVLNRYNRCSFERVIACLLQKNQYNSPLLGNIHHYCRWGIPFEKKDTLKHLPIIKVWTGR